MCDVLDRLEEKGVPKNCRKSVLFHLMHFSTFGDQKDCL